jgi:hypothetical protein
MKQPAGYYVFFFRPGQVTPTGQRQKKSEWKHPKSFSGPYATEAEAKRVRDREIEEYNLPFEQYMIKSLTPAQFERAWGIR